MSVCSATTAASFPGERKGSRGCNSRTSVPDVHFYNDKGRQFDQRKYSGVSSTKSSNSTLCCVVSVVMLVFLSWFGHCSDFIG
ncbi:hypothetical protein DPMN_104967 [Dreissena polymorpha]|uniref:Uncharacterized protein n=1 Tax=Dreissena polymorpha TaxID=45954 RepID=A0A9D4K2Y2_DREPO|nr:hypothetical protein DPMN_104967 [Dreissena polymorpha]